MFFYNTKMRETYMYIPIYVYIPCRIWDMYISAWNSLSISNITYSIADTVHTFSGAAVDFTGLKSDCFT